MLERNENEYHLTNVKRQVLAAVIANFVLVGHGCIAGWMSPIAPILLSEKTPLASGRITNVELSWLGSIGSLGSIVGTVIFGGLVMIFGCKNSMLFLGLPSITFWLSIYFGDTFNDLLFGRFCYGLTAGGVQSGIIVFVSEISNDCIRGRLGSITPLARNIGVLCMYIVGSFVGTSTVEYDVIPAIFIYIPIIYMIGLFFLPNTPSYYLHKGNIKAAEKALMFYKGCKGRSDIEKQALQWEFEKLKTITEESKMCDKISWRDLNNRTALTGLMIGVAMAWFLQCTGCFIIINYAQLVFQESEVRNPRFDAIVLAIMQIVSGILSTSLSDTLGRKILLIISLFGSFIGLICLAIYSYIDQNEFDLTRNYSSLPVVGLSFVIAIACLGIAPLSNVCAVEVLPPKIRSAGMVIYTIVYNILSFLGDKYFPIMLDMIHLHGCFLFLAVNCFLGTLFVIFCMKETKGQSLNAKDSTDSISNLQVDFNDEKLVDV